MNQREKTVLIFLSAVLLIGAAVNWYRNWQLKRRLAAFPLNLIRTDTETSDTLIDLNSATPEQLEALPGIGPVLAQRIVSYRERHGGFKNISEVLNVTGIGPKKFAAISGYITCKPYSTFTNRGGARGQASDSSLPARNRRSD